MNLHRAREPVDEFDDSPIKYPSQLPRQSDGKNPYVLIVGAGLAGLLLAILLDKAGIPYEIFERAASVKPLGMNRESEIQRCICDPNLLQKHGLLLCSIIGSIMSLNPSILAALEQANLLDELKAISFPAGESNIMYDNMDIIATFNSTNMPNE
jgi:2-polyprenyl-6-methoxyphenol hydroxylase-like FAD-dependent oxidoreductase